VKINFVFTCFLYLLLCIACNTQHKEQAAEHTTYKIILYSDSTYMYPIDSLAYTNNGDTTYFHKKFRLDGYFRVYNEDKSYFEEGRYTNGYKTGKWLFYKKYPAWYLDEERNYDNSGHERLNGKFIEYAQGDTIPVLIHNYCNNVLVGCQYKFYSSGALHIYSENDSTGAYINNYLVLYENGDTLYYENFGSSGTGTAKYYSQYNSLEWEQSYVNKKQEGWGYEYMTAYNNETDTTVLVERSLFKNDTLISTTNINTIAWKIKDLGREVDSSVIYYLNYEPIKVIYYHKGKVVKVEK